MAFNFFVRKINVPEVVEPPKKQENLINADLLLMKIELLHENYFHVAKTRSGKGEPRGYCVKQKGEFGMIYDSAVEAAEAIGMNPHTLRQVARGDRNPPKGFEIRYVGEAKGKVIV